MARIDQNLQDVPEQPERVVLAPGEYRVRIEDSKVAPSKSGRNMATFTLITEGNGSCNGCYLWENFVLDQDIARQRLKAMAVAAGHPNPNFIRDTEELHGKNLIIKVKIRSDEQYGDQNQITSFKKIGGNGSSGAPVAADRRPPAPPASNGGGAPWNRAKA